MPLHKMNKYVEAPPHKESKRVGAVGGVGGALAGLCHSTDFNQLVPPETRETNTIGIINPLTYMYVFIHTHAHTLTYTHTYIHACIHI